MINDADVVGRAAEYDAGSARPLISENLMMNKRVMVRNAL